MRLRQRFRGYPKGYEFEDGEVSDAQMMLMRKLGVVERSDISLDNTKDEIIQYLKDNDIDFKYSMKKAELIELV